MDTKNKIAVVLPAAGSPDHLHIEKAKLLLHLEEGECLWEHQVNNIQRVMPGSPIFYVVGFGSNELKPLRNKTNLVPNKYFQDNGSAYSAALAINKTGDLDCLVMHGDLVFSDKALTNIRGSGLKNSFVLRDATSLFKETEVGIIDNATQVNGFSYSIPQKFGQVFYLRNEDKSNFVEIASEHRRYHTWEVINRMVRAGTIFDIIDNPPDCTFLEIDDNNDYLLARKVLRHEKNLQEWDY